MIGKASSLYATFLPASRRAALQDAGLLVLRVAASGMMAVHGWEKLTNFSERSSQFPDPLGIGSAASLALATFAELFCSILVALGLATRLALTQLIATMFVAAFVVKGGELAVLFFVVYVALILTGPGRVSIDHLITKKLGAA